MDLPSKLRALGLRLPAVPQFSDSITAIAVIAIAVAVGWLVGRAAALPLTLLLQRATGRPGSATLCDRVRRLLRSGIAALMMVVGSAAVPAGGYAALLLAAMTGLILAVSAYRVAHAAGLRAATAMIAAVVVFVNGAVSMLGGLRSLTASLDAFAFNVGSHRRWLLARLERFPISPHCILSL